MSKIFQYILSVILLVQFIGCQKKVDFPNRIPKSDRPDLYNSYFESITHSLNASTHSYENGYRWSEFEKAKGNTLKKSSELPWVQRGPGNVSGRTRALVIDPDDPTHLTWFAGSASGGIWKTTDGGKNWTDLTRNLPNISTSTLVMAPSNHQIMYAGTGEGFGGTGMVSGNGIFKSVNRGLSWQLLSATGLEHVKFINRIIVDDNDENTVLIASNSGIFKSIDGGGTWNSVFYNNRRVEDITSVPGDFNILFAGVNGWGIIKSNDKGETWSDANQGISTGRRFEIAVSAVNPQYVYTTVEGVSGNATDIYLSKNQGEQWFKFKEENGRNFNFLSTQGWFNNIVTGHPFEESQLFVAGVNMGKITFGAATENQSPEVLRVDTTETGSFINFIRFGGGYFYGALATGDQEDGKNINSSDWSSVEIRFGNSLHQKAHRFSVPEGSGSGVDPLLYQYSGYVDVPFEVWDTDHNRQLMISFRDNEGDGQFNLIERQEEAPVLGREYLFISAYTYDSIAPLSQMMENGGHLQKMLYFLWPTVPADSIWSPTEIPESNLKITYGEQPMIIGNAQVVADDKINANLHVDHHELIPVIIDVNSQKFWLIDANDGGLGISKDEGLSWSQVREGYITTQFYGVAKKANNHEYIGGMQDNGTWQSTSGVEATSKTAYIDRVKGDGFEVLWHPQYGHRMLASSYYNRFFVTNDGGENWEFVSAALNDDGPFLTKLSNSADNPNLVFAVGSRGVYSHVNFGLGRAEWNLKVIEDGWSVNNMVSSSHQVKVSLADPSIVWAGAGMFADPHLCFFVSEDYGKTFDSTTIYSNDELGFCSGFATHPQERETAYALFSIQGKSKVLKTNDLGKSWKDISGFGSKDSSDNGFPDVMVNCLLVLPSSPSVLWVGTEIGLFESLDGGNSWHYADNGLPAVSIWEMKVQDNEIIVATHGRGIWTLDLNYTAIKTIDNKKNRSLVLYPNPNNGTFFINTTNLPPDIYNLTVADIKGSVVFSNEIDIQQDTEQYMVSLPHFSSGIHIIKISSNSKEYSTRTILY